MPSQRKRIGFLPSEEIHEIIEKICKVNKMSQSKVTGILVEEALRSRGVCKNLINNSNFKNYTVDNPKIKNSDSLINYSLHNNIDSGNHSNTIKDDLKMINEFIEFKLFKKLMSQNKNRYEL